MNSESRLNSREARREAARFNHTLRTAAGLLALHRYRYDWAERAKTVGYPERFAPEALGHNSKAVHRAYAKRVLMQIPVTGRLRETSTG